MKIIILLSIILLSSCAADTGKSGSGNNAKSQAGLLFAISYESHCPAEKIKIISSEADKNKPDSVAQIVLADVCGKQVRYYKFGNAISRY